MKSCRPHRAVKVSTLLPDCSEIDATDQDEVPVAVPAPPRSLTR